MLMEAIKTKKELIDAYKDKPTSNKRLKELEVELEQLEMQKNRFGIKET